MRGANLILAVLPLFILWLLIPAFQAASVPNLVKGSVIGLYLSISIISLLQMRRRP